MKAITLLNEKGGVGKTTLATHIATGLAIKGQRVVLVDADAQGHATITLGLAKEPGLYNLIVRNSAFMDTLRYVSPEIYEKPDEPVTGKLFVVPGNVETRAIPMMVNNALAIKQRLREIRSAVDVVIFDTAPTPSLLHGSIYLATDAVIFPTKPEWLAFDGLKESLNHIEDANSLRTERDLPPIKNMGIVPIMYRGKTLEHSENLEELKEAFGDLVWEPTPLSTVWTEAARVQRPVWNAAPGTRAAADAWNLVERAYKALADVTPQS